MILLSEIINLNLQQALDYCLDKKIFEIKNDIWGIGMEYDLQDIEFCFDTLKEYYNEKIYK